MKIFGIEFAPWRIPTDRRLQVLSVFYFTTSFLFFGTAGVVLCFCLLFTRYYFISLIYLTWLYYDWYTPQKGGRTIRWVRNLKMWRYIASYFPIKLIKTAELDPTKNYIFGFHPHGIIVVGLFTNFGSEATGFQELFPGIDPHIMTLDGNFLTPFHREALMALGCCSVSRESVEWVLSNEGQGNAVVIAVGGAAEALDARPGEATLTIKRRKGFVRLAIKHGASLVPMYSFGENNLYDQFENPVGSPLRTVQEKMTKAFGFSLPILRGRGLFNYTIGYLPRRSPIHTVVGKPIDVTKNEIPTAEEVDRLHNIYLQKLKDLYNQYKGKYGNPEQELLFV